MPLTLELVLNFDPLGFISPCDLPCPSVSDTKLMDVSGILEAGRRELRIQEIVDRSMHLGLNWSFVIRHLRIKN